jgi:DNA replication protein DnaC
MKTKSLASIADGILSDATTKSADAVKFLATLPKSSPCPIHPQVAMAREDYRSLCAGRALFETCWACKASIQRKEEADRIRSMGVPLNLCASTLDNWSPDDGQAKANLDRVREFIKVRHGFLVLLGDFGVGKSHLAVGILRTFRGGLFVKQSELLRQLRQTYRNNEVVDPVTNAQSTPCLVLDDMGISSGGRDELPLIHDILDHRHGNKKPTVLTSNLTFDELCNVIGPRMADRLRESYFGVLIFGGPSRRSEAHSKYFEVGQNDLRPNQVPSDLGSTINGSKTKSHKGGQL